MNDLKDRLKNRTDLEKLEQDLAVIERLVDEDAVGEKIKKLTRQARRDLEAARAAHIQLISRLRSLTPSERQAARRELEGIVLTGTVRLFDPQTRHWQPAADVLDGALAFEEHLERRAAEIRQTEAQLADSATIPLNLHQLHHLILRAEELLRLDDLSEYGKEILVSVRENYESGCRYHRALTLAVHNGTLKERFDALGELRSLAARGEMWILDAPENVWHPADEILAVAEQSCVNESARLCNEAILQAEQMATTNLTAALQDLYLAMDLSIPYINTDRARLKVKYTALCTIYQQSPNQAVNSPAGNGQVSAEDMVGFIAVRSLYQERMKKMVNQSLIWLNQFFHSAMTRPVANLLSEAEEEKTLPARTVELIDMAVSLAENALEGSIEIPEAMIHGAVILYNKGITARAGDLLSSAMPLYTLERVDKIHRHAVTAWLLGSIEYVLGHRLEGYSQWKTARGLFEELRTQAVKDKQTEKAAWYVARLRDMAVYTTQTFEEVYFQWMNQFEMIALPESMKDYRIQMDGQYNADQVLPLRETLNRYLEISQKLPVMAPIWAAHVDAAFYMYEIRDYVAALNHLNQAWVGFQSSHRGAVALWLSGMIQWWFPSKSDAAIDNWETSIRIFRDLSKVAEQNDRKNQHAWYDAQVELMTTSLKDWLQMTKAG